MSDDNPESVTDIRAEIDKTRADLAETVDALSDKLNVKAQAAHKVDDAKAGVQHAAAKAKDAIDHVARAAPEPVKHTIAKAEGAVAPVARRAKPYGKQIAAGMGTALLGLILVRRRRSKARDRDR